MGYLTINETADIMGLTPRRIQQMCKNGEIEGAVKRGRTWMVPENTGIVAEERLAYGERRISRNNKILPLPIGVSDYINTVSNYYYVDKTLLIKDFIDTLPVVSLFTRPRRFGKTLMMNMLKVFFEKTPEDNSVYFKDKEIWKCGERYRSFQGKFPVIFLTFKDNKYNDWDKAYSDLCKIIAAEFERHSELRESDKCSRVNLSDYEKIVSGKADDVEMSRSLFTLSKMLHDHYGAPAIIIIDEYDTPIQQGFIHGYYEQAIAFIRNLFSSAFKDNSDLAYGFLTGILRVAKESIFSGLNNLRVNSVMENRFSEYFGFTDPEIKKLLRYYGREDKYGEILDWYDGYRFGNTEIFNPWSVLNYIDENCTPKAFWQSTGSNDIIGEIVSSATPEISENLSRLLQGETVSTYVDTGVIYPEIRDNPSSIYSFLVVTGYLRNSEIFPQEDGGYICRVSIPNKEIAYVYSREVISKAFSGAGESTAVRISKAIFDRNISEIEKGISDYLLQSISYFDTADEAFYHGLILGLCAVLNKRYSVKSNRESGLGRFDIQLTPLIVGIPAFIFELKVAKNSKESLEKLADGALKQIEDKKYDTELMKKDAGNIIKLGIAFYGKKAVVKKSV